MKTFWLTLIISLVLSILVAVWTDVYLLERIAIVGDFAGLQRSYNPGVAFGIELPNILESILIVIALIMVAWMARHQTGQMSQVAFGLILGGGFANVVDRLRDGLVSDLFQVGSFPIFNVADSCISIGVGILLLEMVLASYFKKS